LAELLLATIEAERELPPILQAAFTAQSPGSSRMEFDDANSAARAPVWICYYKNPDSRGRRMQKAIDQALETVEKEQTQINR